MQPHICEKMGVWDSPTFIPAPGDELGEGAVAGGNVPATSPLHHVATGGQNAHPEPVHALRRQTLTLVNSGPAGGKSTLIAQAVKAHFEGKNFFIKGLNLPDGDVCWVQTDRQQATHNIPLKAMGLANHPRLHILNFVDDTELHQLTIPQPKQSEPAQIARLRNAVSERIEGLNIGTLILDLYDDFQTGDTKNGKKMAFDGRCNLRWCMKMDLAIVGVNYSFKQTGQNAAKRLQDRSAGNLKGQASASWKITLVDAEELGEAYGIVEAKPGPGEGTPETIQVRRGTQDDGDYVGLFSAYDGPLNQAEERLEKFYQALPEVQFTTHEAVVIGDHTKTAPTRITVNRYLKDLSDGKHTWLTRSSRGVWRKSWIPPVSGH